ncbi:hypothetical protein FRX31_019612 [Thalictrum thalictroides]|uniref:Uncharacterized protein n=1 Tax=Thalictrum thalictroides TaxID=46969 RepID=A0A7J6W1H2_THATH|nr:hypothetical protein FRX31_019612 [Thalictrum thalictroides]
MGIFLKPTHRLRQTWVAFINCITVINSWLELLGWQMAQRYSELCHMSTVSEFGGEGVDAADGC